MKFHGKQWIIVKQLYVQFRKLSLQTISSLALIRSTYYFLFSSTYIREQRAVLAGLKRHMDDLHNSPSLYVLRRNIHRLEKGLITKNRKDVFAKEYIGETVEFYCKCLERYQAVEIPEEMRWAKDILTIYFYTVGDDPLILRAKTVFFSSIADDAAALPDHRYNCEEDTAAYNNLHHLAGKRKSVRSFLPEPVDRNLIDRALQIAAKAPSSCNRQPVQYRIFDDRHLVKEIAGLPLGARSFADNIPVICAVTGDLSAYFYERDRHSIYVDGSLSAMLFMLALETVGLASCPLNWAEIDSLDRKLEKKLGLFAYERAIMFIAIGYPDPAGKVAQSEKKSLDLLRSYNRVVE